MNKHTPGPWATEDFQEGFVKPEDDEFEGKGWAYKSAYLKSGSTIIGEVKAMQTDQFLNDFEQCTANAKLISAAPELLEALQECRNWYENNAARLAPDTPICFSKALSAIQKATV